MGWGVTLSGNVVGRETVAAETHQQRRDGTVAFGGRSPNAAPATMAFDDLESLGIDVGPMMGHMHGLVRWQAVVRH